jgi:hypothetical protein
MTSTDLLRQYAQFAGFQPVGVSQDGASGIYQTPTGLQTIPFHEALQGVGAQVEAYKPQNAIPAENMLKYRMALESISDPDVRQAYFKTVATRDFGQENPLIVNNGTDTYLWDAGKGSWVALTNAPGLDMSDIAAGAASLGKGALSVGGGLLGAAGAGLIGLPSGPGAIAAAAGGAGLGSAAGSALGDLAQAGITSALDPDFRQNYSLAKEASGIGQRAALSGALGAAGPVVGAVMPGLQALRPSSVMQGAGSGLKGAGQVSSSIARGLDTDLGRMGMQMGLDPTGISGIGAVGGIAREYAAPAAQNLTKGFDKIRAGFNAVRGAEQQAPIAGATWADTAKNIPGVGQFVQGVTGLGTAAEKLGRGVENTIIGTGKAVGGGLQAAGAGLKGAGKVAGALEAPAVRAGASRELDAMRAQPQTWGQQEQYITAGLDPIQRGPGGVMLASTGPSTLQDELAARGGFYNVIR